MQIITAVLQNFNLGLLGSADYFVDTVILATNEGLQRAVDSGHFRQDLSYRINDPP
jgi:transcriptional regulator with GAF, ATPase, and Fis domain